MPGRFGVPETIWQGLMPGDQRCEAGGTLPRRVRGVEAGSRAIVTAFGVI